MKSKSAAKLWKKKNEGKIFGFFSSRFFLALKEFHAFLTDLMFFSRIKSMTEMEKKSMIPSERGLKGTADPGIWVSLNESKYVM